MFGGVFISFVELCVGFWFDFIYSISIFFFFCSYDILVFFLEVGVNGFF